MFIVVWCLALLLAFVFSILWSELLMTSAISCHLWSSVYECQRVECAFTSQVRTKCGMFVVCCICSVICQCQLCCSAWMCYLLSIWSHLASSINKLQTLTNTALRTATGCTQNTNTQHLTTYIHLSPLDL